MMSDLPALIHEYCQVLDQERSLQERKDGLRRKIQACLAAQQAKVFVAPFGSARRCSRFKLRPKRDAVLSLLSSDDLFPFAQFSPNRVKSLLVPKYGRERLLPLFDIEKTEFVMVQRTRGPG